MTAHARPLLLLSLALWGCGDSGTTILSDSGTATGATAGTTASSTATATTTTTATNTGPTASASATETSTTSTGPTTRGPTSATDPSTTGTTTASSDPTGSSSTDNSSTGSTDSSSTGATGVMSDSNTGSSTGDPPDCQDPNDCPAPPECQEATCDQGVCGTEPSAMGTPCQGDQQCDGQGDCVECLQDADCPSLVCDNGVCQDAACDDGVQNGDETDTDCGGGCPDKCAEGQGCDGDGDCETDNCVQGTCEAAGPACLNAPPNPNTGQGCPIFHPCDEFADCGVFQGCQQWYCDNGECALNTLSDCWDTVGGQCNADVVITQHDDPPVDKDFLVPDNVDFREVGSMTFTIQNNTPDDLYLDEIPFQLDVMGGGSSFDVSSLKMYQDFGGSDWQTPGDFYICITGNPFQFPANGVLGPCGGSFASRVSKNGGTRRFVVTFAFAKEKTFIGGRSYRLRMDSNAVLEFRVGGTNGPPFNGTQCGIPNNDFVGAWVHAKDP